jgi:hypothetical protein
LLLQYLQNLPDLLLPPLEFSREVVKPRRKILDSKWKVEVKGEDEDDDNKGDLTEDTEKGKAFLFLATGMWGMSRPYQWFVKFHKPTSLSL